VRARSGSGYHREILALSVPAFLTLVAEPLFLLADSAIIGHLGVDELAALGAAGAVVATAVGLCIFLAYGTTAAVARAAGAGDERAAVRAGVDGSWLAVGVGVAAVLVLEVAAPWLVGLFGAGEAVAEAAVGYLRIAAFGLPGLLIGLAATGILRGFADTRTPLVVTVVTQALNVGANLLLVFGLGGWPGLGLLGSAIGSVGAQTLGGLAFGAVVVRYARDRGVGLRPDRAGVRATGRASVPLIVRTVTLRAALLLAAVVAGHLRTVALAAHQIAVNVWNLLALGLDAVAIAAQTLTGRTLGAGDASYTRAVVGVMTRWGFVSGVILGVVLAAGHRVIPVLFTTDPQVRTLLASVLLVAAVWQPVNGIVFVLDGVLIGAGDATYLARAGMLTLVVFVPLALLVWGSGVGLAALWWAFGVFMLSRLVSLVLRARGDAWLRTGARLG